MLCCWARLLAAPPRPPASCIGCLPRSPAASLNSLCPDSWSARRLPRPPPQDRVALRLEAHMGSVEALQWTRDGQILTAASSSGDLITLLGDLPTLGVANGNR